MSAAALSAAVDSYNFNGEHTHFQAEPILQKNYPQRQPLSGREREEGKDSHSRQWRLSMAVFLNRNKRPLAAPIEVAEPFSERPPPSHLYMYVALRKGVRGRTLLYREVFSPEIPYVISLL